MNFENFSVEESWDGGFVGNRYTVSNVGWHENLAAAAGGQIAER